MFRYSLFAFMLLSIMSFTHKSEKTYSPQGDTRMGSDAATSGTDLDDKDIQAQEDLRKVPNQNQETQKKETKTNENDYGLPTN